MPEYQDKADLVAHSYNKKGGPLGYDKWSQNVCSSCGKYFGDDGTAEEKLLRAIFGQDRCDTCYKHLGEQKCTYCRNWISLDQEVLVDRMPYHSGCAYKKYKDLPTDD